MGLRPHLIVFDLDACLWTPEMYELPRSPTTYCHKRDGVAVGRGDRGHGVVKLYDGAKDVLQRFVPGSSNHDAELAAAKVAVASSTTEPDYAATCLAELRVHAKEHPDVVVADLVHFRQIYPGSKGRQHFPALLAETGIPFEGMLFFDDCTYSDNCGEVARMCPGAACARTPHGMTAAIFDAALEAFARGERGVLL